MANSIFLQAGLSSGSFPVGTAPTTEIDAIAAATTDGQVFQNITPATAAIPVQMPPRLRLRGQVWNTTAAGSAATDDMWIESLPVSGATPSGIFRVQSSLNGGAAATIMQVTSAGQMQLGGGTVFLQSTQLVFGATAQISWNTSSKMANVSDGKIKMNDAAATNGIGLDFSANAVLKIRTTDHVSYATLDALGYKASGTAGVASFGPAAVASITVVGGIITAIS